MGNTRYPPGLKGKSSLAWIGGAAIGFSPLFFYYYTYLMKEHYLGNCPRKTFGEDGFFHKWMLSSFRHSVQMGEALRVHPQYKYSKTDRVRLRLTELHGIIKD